MKHLSRFELDAHPPEAPLYHAPGAFASGMVAGIGVAILWALWWPLGVLAVILAYCVCLCATQVKRSTEYYAREDYAANVNRGPGVHIVDTPEVGPEFDPPSLRRPVWVQRSDQTDVF